MAHSKEDYQKFDELEQEHFQEMQELQSQSQDHGIEEFDNDSPF